MLEMLRKKFKAEVAELASEELKFALTISHTNGIQFRVSGPDCRLFIDEFL